MQLSMDQLVGVIATFVTQKRGPGRVITPDTALLADGHLDSFALIALTLELEKAMGSEIPSGALIPEDFETPTVLFERLQQL